jgi:uncharacterized protein (TIGR02145 family)
MRKLFTFILAVLLMASVFAQTPQKMSYQAVIRDISDNLVTNQSVGMQISILQGSENGTAVYVETQMPSTNANGLVSIEIGTGTIISGDFATIDWAHDTYFIKTETDLAGGTSYSITGTSQLLSVPYALHAKTAESVTGTITETDPSVPSGTQIGQMQYWNGTAWITVNAGNEGQMLTFVGGLPTWTTVVGVTTLGSNDVLNPKTSKIWMDRNLGASQVAISSTDTNAYGDLYQWGRGTDGHEKRTSGTTSTLATSDTPGHGDVIFAPSIPHDWHSPQNDNLWQGVGGTNNPCPSGYRLPTNAEWEAERTSWSSQNADGAFGSPLKLPAAGLRYSTDGSLHYEGYLGHYWSSTVDGTNSRDLGFGVIDAKMYSNYRAFSYSVRCIKN